MSKKIEIEVSDEVFEAFSEDSHYYSQLLKNTLTEAVAQKSQNPTDWVKALTRLKTPVCSWPELEKQVMLGAIGESFET